MMKCVGTIHPYRLSDLKYSQLVLAETSATSIETCRYIIAHREHLFCNPLQQPRKIGILSYPDQQFGDQNLYQQLIQLGLITANSSRKIFTRTATLEDIRQCIAFTVAARLAVRWNPVGKWFVHRQQHYFLDIEDSNETFQAVKFDIVIPDTHDRIEVWICSGELQLFPITPQNLVLNSDELTYFMEDPGAVVNFAPSSHHRFYYLPKVTTGTLVSISRHLPANSPFNSYTDLCNYWQQQYGYELPKESNGIVYFNVSFTNDGTIYTYPSCCVFLQPPEMLTTSSVTSLSIVRQFWQDFEPLLQHFPGKVVSDTWLLNPLARIPLQQKLAADIEYDVKAKTLLRFQEQKSNFSQYFLRTHVDNFNRKQESDKADQQKKSKKLNTASNSQQVSTNHKITKYFSAQHPNVKIRRTNNKISFNPLSNEKDSMTHGNHALRKSKME